MIRHCQDDALCILNILGRKERLMISMHGINNGGICLFPQRHISGIFFCELFICRVMVYLCIITVIFDTSGNGIVLDNIKLYLT